MQSQRFLKDKKYWTDLFEVIPEIAKIPGSVNSNSNNNDISALRKIYSLDKISVQKLNDYCKSHKISLYNFFMSIYAIYISKISGQEQFVIGTPILNRTNFKEKHTSGMFINVAPFKVNLNNSKNFNTFVKNIATDSLNMLKHQKYSYQCLLEDLRAKNKNIPNLYNILFSYQISNTQENSCDINYETDWTFNNCCSNDIDIHIFDLNNTGSLNIAYDYKTSLYTKQDIENIHQRILHIIRQIISKEDISIDEIELVTPHEKNKILNVFNNTKVDYPKNKSITQLFEEQVQKTPDNIALVFKDKQLTYNELNEKANQLARFLVSKKIKPNDICAIVLNRSLEMIIAILAVLKAGAAYIPIDPTYPKDRIKYILKNSNAKFVLNEKDFKNLSFDNSNLNIKNNPDDLSYIIYTSGSTGLPKGVMLKHQSLSNLTNYCNSHVEYLKNDISKEEQNQMKNEFNNWCKYNSARILGWFDTIIDKTNKDNNEPSFVVLGFADRDEEICKQFVFEKLSSEYASIFLVTLDNDYYRFVSRNVSSGFKDVEGGSYTAVIRDYANRVHPDYYDEWIKLANISFVKKYLANENRRELTYKLMGVDDKWRRCILQVIERKNGVPVSFIMTYMTLDDISAEKHELDKKIKEQAALLDIQRKDQEKLHKIINRFAQIYKGKINPRVTQQ